MAKDAYWFRHDSNASTDPKMMRLTAKYGCAGYGAFWRVIEFIHSHCSGVLERSDVEILASEFRYPELPAMIDDCCAWGLFEVDGGGERVVSKRLNEELQLLADRKDAGKSAAQRRWHGNANPLGAQCATHARGNAQTEKTDREDRTERTESTNRDEIGEPRGKGRGPTAVSAGVESPAGRPGEAEHEPEPDAAKDLPPSVLPLHELPDKLRAATARARLKVEAEARRKADHLTQKTADYRAVAQPANGARASPVAQPYSARSAPPETEFEDFPEAEA